LTLYSAQKKISSLIILNLFLFTPLIFLKSTSDTYLLIKQLFVALNTTILLYINSIFEKRSLFQRVKDLPFSLPISIFFLASILSFVRITRLHDYLITLVNLFLYFSLYILLSSEVCPANPIKIMVLFTASSFLVSVYGIFQYADIGYIGPLDFKPAVDYYHLVMHPSTLGHDNFAGEFIAPLIPFALCLLTLLILRNKIFLSGLVSLSLAIIISYLVITQARGSWLGFTSSIMIMLPLYLLKFNKKERLRFSMIIIVIIVLLVFLFYLILAEEISRYKEKFKSIFNLQDNPIKFRFHVWQSTLKLIKEYFPLGVGAGNFKHIYPLFRDLEEIRISGPNIMVRKTHNEYLQIAAEEGLLGLFSFIWLITASYKSLFRLLKGAKTKSSPMRFFILVSLTGSLTAHLVQSFFGFSLQNPSSLLVFIWTLAIISKLDGNLDHEI